MNTYAEWIDHIVVGAVLGGVIGLIVGLSNRWFGWPALSWAQVLFIVILGFVMMVFGWFSHLDERLKRLEKQLDNIEKRIDGGNESLDAWDA